jgi:hypothetical protein
VADAALTCRTGAYSEAWLRHCVTSAKERRDESRRRRHECPRHVGRPCQAGFTNTRNSSRGSPLRSMEKRSGWAIEQGFDPCYRKIAEQCAIRPGDEIDWVAAGEVIRMVPPGKQATAENRESQLRLFDQATERGLAKEVGEERTSTGVAALIDTNN